jgi:hypothetical protein
VAEHVVEIGLEEIAFDHPHVPRHLAWKRGRQVAIDFNRNQLADERRQRFRQGAASRADLEERLVPTGIERGDQLVDPGLFEEVLSEPLARARPLPAAGR